MKNKIIWLVLVVVLIVLLVIFNNKGDNVEGKTFRIGVSQTLTGPAAYYGESNKRGVDLAKKEIDLKYPKINFEVYHEDNQYSPKVAVDNYRKLRFDKNIDAIITQPSPASFAILPLAQKDNVLQVAASTAAKNYTTPDDLSFRTSLGTDKEVEVLIDYVQKKCGGNINILGMNNEIGMSISESMKNSAVKLNIKVGLYEMFSVDTTDFRSLILKYKEHDNNGCLFFPALASHAVNFLKQSKELDFSPILLSFRTMEDPTIMKAADLAEGMIVTSSFDPYSFGKETKEFVEKYKVEYNMLPDTYAAEGYLATMLIADSLVKCSDDKDCLFKYLSTLKNYPTIVGDVSFDKNGDIDYEYGLAEIRGGKVVRIK